MDASENQHCKFVEIFDKIKETLSRTSFFVPSSLLSFLHFHFSLLFLMVLGFVQYWLHVFFSTACFTVSSSVIGSNSSVRLCLLFLVH